MHGKFWALKILVISGPCVLKPKMHRLIARPPKKLDISEFHSKLLKIKIQKMGLLFFIIFFAGARIQVQR